MRYESFHEAFIQNLEQTYAFPQFINSPRGFYSRERLNCHFTLTNPIERACYLPTRKANIVFNFAEALWHLSGDNSLEYISYYAKNMSKYSQDGRILTGSAYGPKIFSYGKEKVNQWDKVIKLLEEQDPDSKRAFIQIFDANEVLDSSNIDVSCTTGLHFLVRNGHLYLFCYMRGNDAYRGIVSDIFCFTLMQELMASQLNLKLGDYYHQVSSMDVFMIDEKPIKKVLDEIKINPALKKPLFQFPQMPLGDNWPHLQKVIHYEALLRERKIYLKNLDLVQLNLPSYWQQVLLLFALYQDIYYNNLINYSLYEQLLPIYQYLVSNRWASLFKQPEYINMKMEKAI